LCFELVLATHHLQAILLQSQSKFWAFPFRPYSDLLLSSNSNLLRVFGHFGPTSGLFSLASQVEIYQITLLLVSNQILMQFHAAVIITFFSAECIVLNGQMVRLNLNGMAKGMLSAAVWC
jgi:hypothetical protein